MSKKSGMAVGFLILTVLLLTGTTFYRLMDKKRKNIIDEPATVIGEDILEGYHDLSSEGSLEFKGICSQQSISVLDEDFKTNSTEIRVTNLSDVTLEVYLMFTGNEKLSNQQFNLEGKTSKVFTNLTSEKLYRIGIYSSENVDYFVKISE